MRKNIVAGNWKMNKTLQEGIALAKELNEALAADKPNCDVVICTPFIHLASVTPIVDSAVIGVGAENCADKVQLPLAQGHVQGKGLKVATCILWFVIPLMLISLLDRLYFFHKRKQQGQLIKTEDEDNINPLIK